MKQTANYNFNKPDEDDFYNISDFNENFDSVDAELKKQADIFTEHLDAENPHHVTKEEVGLGNVDNTSDSVKPVSAAQQDAIDASYQQATGYTDQKIADLIGGAPTTLDTLKEIADAISENKSVVEALDFAIGTKANDTDFQNHKTNNTLHITASERTAWNNKANNNHGNHISGTTATSGRFLKSTATSGTTAWGSVGKEDITGALGYTPLNPKNTIMVDSYWNESNLYAQTKCITIVFPYNGSVSPAYPNYLIRLTCMHNASAFSGVGTYVLHSTSIDSAPKWDKIGGEDIAFVSEGVAFEDGICTFKFKIVVRQHGFLFIEHNGTTEVIIANSF